MLHRRCGPVPVFPRVSARKQWRRPPLRIVADHTVFDCRDYIRRMMRPYQSDRARIPESNETLPYYLFPFRENANTATNTNAPIASGEMLSKKPGATSPPTYCIGGPPPTSTGGNSGVYGTCPIGGGVPVVGAVCDDGAYGAPAGGCTGCNDVDTGDG